MFERSLRDVIAGARQACYEERYLDAIHEEIRSEIKSPHSEVQANAILKLTYVSMYACQKITTYLSLVTHAGISDGMGFLCHPSINELIVPFYQEDSLSGGLAFFP